MKKIFFNLCIACSLALTALAQESAQTKKSATLRFDFGGGEVAEGFIGVTASTGYSETLGYGFEDGAKIIETVRTPKKKKTSMR